MAVGSSYKTAVKSYVAYGKETTYGTYNSATTATQPISCTFKTSIESEKLETLGINRGQGFRVQKQKVAVS